jgi:hypothetical protein
LDLHLGLRFWLGNAPGLIPLFLVLALSTSPSWGQGNSAATGTPTFILDQCKREVLAYQKNLEALRKSLGDKAAQEFADKFMTKEQWNDSLLRDGYCAIARGLKANRLN